MAVRLGARQMGAMFSFPWVPRRAAQVARQLTPKGG